MSQRTSALVAAAALGACLLAGRAFVPGLRGPAPTQPPALGHGSTPETGAAGAPHAGVAALGLAACACLAARRRPAAPRTACRAEPVSVAAAAAAAKAAGVAKAAAAAKGAAKTAGAVAGSAGAGTMVQSSADADEGYDEELGKRKFFPKDRGTPEYEKYMKQLRRLKEEAWEVRTARNPDGTFSSPDSKRKGDLYDPLMTTDANWLDEAKEAGLYNGEFDPAFQVGVTEPLGFFDPLGFCSKGDKKNFTKLRAAEIKHGRVAMMAAVGGVAQHYIQFPGFKDVPKGLGAVNNAPGSYGAIALFLVVGILELDAWTENPNKEPGNFGDPLGFDMYTEEFRNRELNNGRMAMFAAAGIIAAELLTGKDAIEQFGL